MVSKDTEIKSLKRRISQLEKDIADRDLNLEDLATDFANKQSLIFTMTLDRSEMLAVMHNLFSSLQSISGNFFLNKKERIKIKKALDILQENMDERR